MAPHSDDSALMGWSQSPPVPDWRAKQAAMHADTRRAQVGDLAWSLGAVLGLVVVGFVAFSVVYALGLERGGRDEAKKQAAYEASLRAEFDARQQRMAKVHAIELAQAVADAKKQADKALANLRAAVGAGSQYRRLDCEHSPDGLRQLNQALAGADQQEPRAVANERQAGD